MSHPLAAGTVLEQLSTQYDLITTLQKTSRLDAEKLYSLPYTGAFDTPLVRATHPVANPAPTVLAPSDKPAPQFTLHEALESRTSERFFKDEPVNMTQVGAILDAAQAHDQQQWHGENVAGLPLDLLVAAANVQGLDRGIYRRTKQGFDPLLTFQDPLDDLVLQAEFASAPLIVVAVLPLAGELKRWGDHGERVANLRAGGAIAAGLLEAGRLGLAASPFAGFLAAPFRMLVTVDGYHNAALFAGAFGHRWTP